MKFDSHTPGAWRDLAVEAARGWQRDGAPSMGAALAFYTLFSMAPLLLLAISIAGIAIGTDSAREMLMTQLTSLMGEQGAGAVRSVLQAANEHSEGVWSAMVATIGFLLMVSLAVSAAVTAVGSMWAGGFPGSALLLRAIEFTGSFVVITGLFAMIYKILPSVRIAWGDVWVGAAVTSLLFWIGKFLIGVYLGRSAIASPFGAAGTLVVVIVWVYYSAQIFFLGAEFTRAYALRLGSLRV